MQIETVRIDQLRQDPKNVRSHSPKNLEVIRRSLERFGQQKPIVVDANGLVVAGNGTLAAAQALGWTEIKIARTELTGDEARAYAIAGRAGGLAKAGVARAKQPLSSTLPIPSSPPPFLPSSPHPFKPSSPPPSGEAEKREKGFFKTPLPEEKGREKGRRPPIAVTRAALENDRTLLRLYEGAVAKKWVQDSEADRLSYFAAAEHSLAKDLGDGAGDLFASIISEGNRKVITEEDENRARLRLKAINQS